ncbi:MAG: hypothetical protein FJ029_10540, partial [Actinobacteria bacterium]|nr:hypothetical protein [Actinomycetota bacterium]
MLRKPLGLVLVAAGGAAAGVLAARTPAPAAMAGALALIGVALALTRPGVALYAIGGLALTVPYAVVPARAGVQPPILDIIIILTLAATVAWAVRTRQPLGPSWLIALVAAGVLLPLAAGLNAWAAAREVEAAQRAVKLAIAAALPLAGTFWMRPDSAVRHVPALVAWIATAQAIAALVLHVAGAEGIQALTAIGPAGYPVEEVARYLPDQTTPRATGLLVDPNVLGVTLAACVPFVFAWMSGPRWCR